jgi:hypothetical protein
MNERIKQLALQAELPLLDVDGNCKYGDTYFSKEKFAELIVQECIDTVSDCSVEYCTRPQIVKEIKQHFGVGK